MSAEGPVRKPSSEPPDVDSLMSRLDGESGEGKERISDPGPERRPSAAELLGGRGRRTKRTIRVPDDAVPAATPPPAQVRRSAPPPPMPPIPVVGMSSGQHPVAAPVAPPVEEEPKRPSWIAPPDSSGAVRVMGHRIISVGGPSSIPPAEIKASASVPAPAETKPASVPALDDMKPASVPAPPTYDPPPTVKAGSAPSPTGPTGPASDVRLAAEPIAPVQPLAQSGETPAVTLPNLDLQVKEALALLDREDFETTIEIAVEPEARDNSPTSTEETLDDAPVVEEIALPQPSKKVVTAPTPPPRRAQSDSRPATAISDPNIPAMPQVNTLPSAAATAPEAVSQPKIVSAAAATSASAPAAGPAIAPASPAPSAAPVSAPSAEASGELRKKKKQWFEELFNDDYARTLPKVDARYLEREVRFIEESLGCDKGATILDLGCGPGEHAVALAARGYEVIGIDLSLAMLARAADEAADKNQRINFLQGDMRDLTFEDAFDGIYCWNTTFGYFDDAKNAEVVQKVHRALRRGGRFLLDVANRDFVVKQTPSMVWFEGDGCVCMDEVSHNAITSRLQVKRTMMMEDGRQREIDYSIRLYALHELGKLLHDSGFRIAEASGDSSTPGVYFGADSPRILILAEKR